MTSPPLAFSPEDLATTDDPYALLASVREAGAVIHSKGNWIVLGYEAAGTILTSKGARSGFIADLYRRVLPPGAAREEMSHRINFLDAPDHARVRNLIVKAFTPRRINLLRPYIKNLCTERLASLDGDDAIDLIPNFTHQVPSLVISELLGVPMDNRDRLTELADRVAALLGLRGSNPAQIEDAVAAAEEMHAYLRTLLEERRREPQDDLLSALLAVEEDQTRLTESEMMSLAATLYSAGHRTTRDLFTNGLSVLLAHPELVAEVVDDTLPVEAMVEEFLRYETPTHYVARMLNESMQFDGVEIPAGHPVAIMLAAANRDPDVYEDPDRFDPHRWTNDPAPPQPLSFAMGPHYCLGANLARLEAQVMLETLLKLYPDIRLADEELRWWHSGLFRGLESLPVKLGQRAAVSI